MVDDTVITHCMLLGADFLGDNNLTVDFLVAALRHDSHGFPVAKLIMVVVTETAFLAGGGA